VVKDCQGEATGFTAVVAGTSRELLVLKGCKGMLAFAEVLGTARGSERDQAFLGLGLEVDEVPNELEAAFARRFLMHKIAMAAINTNPPTPPATPAMRAVLVELEGLY
jgi:DNA mismatch repair protein MutH